jgi:hypothetical protein
MATGSIFLFYEAGPPIGQPQVPYDPIHMAEAERAFCRQAYKNEQGQVVFGVGYVPAGLARIA